MSDWPALPYIQSDRVYQADWVDLVSALPDGSIDLMLTDMPYNLTQCPWESEIDLARWWQVVLPKMKPDAAVVLTAKDPFSSLLLASAPALFRTKWVWDKGRVTGFLNARHYPLQVTEDVLVFCQAKPRYYPQMWWSGIPKASPGNRATPVYGDMQPQRYSSTGQRYPLNLIRIPMPAAERGKHPTQKPIALMQYFIKTYSLPGELVVDPFVGSGTTGIAARLENRRYIVGDIDPAYVDLSRQRIEQEGRRIEELPLFEALS